GLGAAVGATGNTNFLAGNYDTNCDGVANGTAYNSGNLSFNDAGELRPRQAAGACAVPDRAAGSDRYNFAPDNLLVIPAERFTISTIGTYDITDDIKLRTQVSYTNSWQKVQLAPTPATGLTVSLTPAMQSLISNRHPDLWAALQSRPNPLASFTMDRRMNEVGTRVGESENNALAILNTLTGSLFGDWDWSLTGSYGVNNFTSNGQHSTNKTALLQGLAGCQDAATGASLGVNALPGCVPLDIFGAGTLNSAMVNFLDVPTFSTTEIEEKRVAGFVRGTVFELPAGPLATVFGFEYRNSSADYRVDNEQRTGNIFGFNAVQNQKGSIEVTELYTEVAVPLLADLPFVNYLGLEGGYRSSDYSTIGRVETYKVGLEYEPTDWLKVRAVYNSAVRAPSVFELFQNGDQGFAGYTDPCAGTQASAQLLAFCSAQSGGYDFDGFSQLNSQVEVFSFGNPDLQPEDAETTTVGIVFQPSSFGIGQFRASLDYYDVNIENLVADFGAGFWIDQCYSSLDASSEACSRVVRDPLTGQIDYVNASRGNVGYQRTKGYDLQIDWSIPLEDYTPLPGRLRLNELFSYVESLDVDGTEYAGTSAAYIGGGLFDFKSVFSAAYDVADFTFFARWTYVPELEDIAFGANYFDGSPTYAPDASYVDVSARWDVTDTLQLTAFVGNVFDEETPQIASGVPYGQANTDTQVYRTFGRTFSVSARARF
ncbi:MAG: TonB-dependent receptor, partial [Caulobacteraceae bacterium]